jgi:uncharacterized membrane protein YkvA (DUF1232 family)
VAKAEGSSRAKKAAPAKAKSPAKLKSTAKGASKASPKAPSAAGVKSKALAKTTSSATPATASKAVATRKPRATSNPSGKAPAASKARKGTAPRKKTDLAAQTYANRAENYRDNPAKTSRLLKDAQKLAKKNDGPLREAFDDISTLVRLVRAYISGDYEEVPWETIAFAIGALIYLVSPADLIPDVIPGVGFVDDVAVIAFVVMSARNDLNNFQDWEAEQAEAAA